MHCGIFFISYLGVGMHIMMVSLSKFNKAIVQHLFRCQISVLTRTFYCAVCLVHHMPMMHFDVTAGSRFVEIT